MTIEEKLNKIAENVPKVYKAGVDVGIKEGKRVEYEAFWDMVQVNGTRANYDSGFMRWGGEYIRPKYKVVPTVDASRKFTFKGNASLKRIEKEYFDFSQCPKGTMNDHGYYQTFYNCESLEVVEDVGMNNAYSFYSTFAYSSKLHTIECIYPDEDTVFSQAFLSCRNLVYLRVDGIIGRNGFNVQDSKKLDKESISSIINALSTTTTGLTVTLSIDAVNKAFETSVGANDGEKSPEWATLTATRSDWNISLL